MKKKMLSVTNVKLLTLLVLLAVILFGARTPTMLAQESSPPLSETPPPIAEDEQAMEMIVTSDGLTFSATEFLELEEGELSISSDSFAGKDGLEDLSITADDKPIDGINGPMPSSIIGPDGRRRVNPTTSYPHRAVVHLRITWPNGRSGGCTGWLIGPRTVATAGHCVYDHDQGGWAKSIRAYPGRNGSSTPYGSSTAHRLFTVVGWTRYKSKDYDYGAIQLNSPKGNQVGWFGFRWQSSNTFGGAYTITGYPGDKPYGTMWKMSNNPGIRRVWSRRLFYKIDTYGGQSGAPVYHKYRSRCCYSVAIHTNGIGADPYRRYNSGTRITRSVFNNLLSWKRYPYP